MSEPQNSNKIPVWVLRLALALCVLASVPLYMVFLRNAAHQWALQLAPGDFARTVLPFVVPVAAFSFTLTAASSWWMTIFSGRPFMLGRTGWWYLIVFVAALSLTAGIIGTKVPLNFNNVLFVVVISGIGMLGVWLLPPALSPRLLDGLPKRHGRTQPTP